jgi:hypothetical protein
MPADATAQSASIDQRLEGVLEIGVAEVSVVEADFADGPAALEPRRPSFDHRADQGIVVRIFVS